MIHIPPADPEAVELVDQCRRHFRDAELARAELLIREVIAIEPSYRAAYLLLSELLLVQGRWQEGWEARRSADHHTPPRWEGEDLTGKSILICNEGGFGDVMQFCRFAPMLASRGARMRIAAPPELARLFSGIKGISDLPPGDLDFHCRQHDLPRLLCASEADIPREPYLMPFRGDYERWRAMLQYDASLRVGLCWAGRKEMANDRVRSISPELLAPLASVPGVSFYSLQTCRTAEGIPFPMIDYTSSLYDFADTAGLIANLHLVISVDSAVCHLAAGMGMPTWTLLRLSPEWRWPQHSDQTPWYPSMKLYRQARLGDWEAVIARVRHDLEPAREQFKGLSPVWD